MGQFRRFVALLIVSALALHCGPGNNNKPPPTIAMAPTSLTAIKRSTARIDLAWVDNSDNEFEFRIERSDDGGASYVQVGTAIKDSQSYTDSGLLPNKTYFYRVTAWNSKGNSPFAGPASAATDPLVWTQSIGGPGIRADHTAIYDAQGQRMILFGGQDDFFTYYNDLWALDLSDTTANYVGNDHWTMLDNGTAPNAPSARFGHSAIYDSLNRRMIVFGGQDGTVVPGPYQNDVYVLALGTLTWTKQTPTGTPPSPRLGHTAVYDSVNKQMVVFGGNDAAGEKADTFFLSLPASGTFAWSSGPSGPIKRTEHSAVYDSAGRQMIIFGGLDHLQLPDGSDLNSETWSLNLSGTPVWTQPYFGAPFFYRQGHTAVNDTANQRMMLFGGAITNTSTPNVVNDLWALSLNPGSTWTFLDPFAGAPPVARYGHSAVYDSGKGRMVIYGGYDNSLFPLYQDTWISDF